MKISTLFQPLVDELRHWKELYLLRRPILLGLLFYVIVLFILKNFSFFEIPPKRDPSHWSGKKVVLTGLVQDPPDARPKGCVVIIEAETIRSLEKRSKAVSVDGKVLVHVGQANQTFASPGDRLEIFGQIQKPNPTRIPGTFDYAAYLQSKGIYSVVYTGKRSVQNLGPSGKQKLKKLGWGLKNDVLSIFRRHLSPEETAVLGGLVVGNRPRFHPEIKRIFVESGTMHILVASGSNVAFVVGFWYMLIRILFGLSRRWTLVSSIPLIWIYVLVVGLDAPITRAGVMSTVGILAFVLSREDRPYQALGLAALLLLLFDPRILFDVGFQMSFLTVFGMIYFLPHMDTWFRSFPSWGLWTCRLMAATLTAQIWLGPLTMSVFKRFFPIGLVANMIVMPLAAGGLLAGFILVLVDTVHQLIPLSFVLALVRLGVHVYTSNLIELVAFFADNPGISLWVSPPSLLWIVGYYLSCFCVVGIFKSRVCQTGLAVGLILMIFGFLENKKIHSPPKNLTLTWIDHGRRLSVLIQTPKGQAVLINPGQKSTFDPTERILMPYLTDKNIKELDAVILTSLDSSQNSSLPSLKKAIKIKKVIEAKNQKNKKTEIGKLEFEFLSGSKSFKTQMPLILFYEDKKILFSGALPLITQRELVERNILEVDVFQARFSPNIKWHWEFLEKFNANTLIEIGPATKFRPSQPPWDDVRLITPQKKGLYLWSNKKY